MKNIILSLFIAVFAVQMLTAATVSIQQVSNAVPGTGLAVAVTGNFSGVTNGVTAFQFDISIDDACLAAPVIQNSVFAGIQSNLITSTTLRVIWVDYTAHNVTNGKFFDIVFTYNGGNSNLDFITASCTVTASGALPVTTSYTSGWVHMVTPTPGIVISQEVGITGQAVNIPVTATEFYNIGGFTLNISFANPAVISGSITAANINSSLAAGVTVNDLGGGAFRVIWATASTSNISLVNNTKLFDLHFSYVGGTSAISFNTGTSNLNNNAPPYNSIAGVTYTNGSVAGYSAEIKLFLEGLYNSGTGLMNKAKDYVAGSIVDKYSGTIADMVTIELHASGTYGTLIYSATNVALNTDGTVAVNIPIEYSGSYYITIKQRNHIETVSKTIVSFGSRPVAYDFTTAANKAYGDNMKSIGNGKYGVYAGDVNGDGVVNVNDRSPIITNMRAAANGYIVTDLNGDGVINVNDRSIVLLNMRAAVIKKTP